MHLALADLFRARWTDEIHEEWIRNVLRNRSDLTRNQLDRTRSLMDANARDCLVAGYEPLIPTLHLPDPDDRHVLAAAIHARADVILTFNLDDFPTAILGGFGIEAIHPDAFIMSLLDMDESAVCAAVRRQRLSLRNPPKSPEELLTVLEIQGLPRTVARLRGLMERI
jgi:hypothetical protein